MVILEDVRELFAENMTTAGWGRYRRYSQDSGSWHRFQHDEDEVEQKPSDILKAPEITLTKQGDVAVNADDDAAKEAGSFAGSTTQRGGKFTGFADAIGNCPGKFGRRCSGSEVQHNIESSRLQ